MTFERDVIDGRCVVLVVTKEFGPLPSPALLGISGTMHDARDGFLGVSQSNTKPIDYPFLQKKEQRTLQSTTYKIVNTF
jgi:hypothetical protein